MDGTSSTLVSSIPVKQSPASATCTQGGDLECELEGAARHSRIQIATYKESAGTESQSRPGWGMDMVLDVHSPARPGSSRGVWPAAGNKGHNFVTPSTPGV